MEVDAILCNHAEAAEGRLFLNGGGINIAWVMPQPPHMINVSVAGIIQVPWTATNQNHRLVVKMLDADSHVVVPWLPPGAPDVPPVEVAMDINLGRPPILPVGDPQTHPFTVGIQVPLAELGLYTFLVELDGTEMTRLPLRVMPQPQPPQVITVAKGPAAPSDE